MSDKELRDKVNSLRWFHSIDFGNGVVANGSKTNAQIRSEAELFFGSISLKNRTLIDIGAWNGFFSFEAKRRGAARVLATDHFVWTSRLDGRPGFDLARAHLAPDVEDMTIDVPELTVEKVGQFDAVLFAGVFYHLFEAPRYLKQVSTLARHLLIVETHQDLLDVTWPAMAYYPGASLANDSTNFWGPNQALMTFLLTEAGFGEIRYQPNQSDARGVYLAFRDAASIAAMGFDGDQGPNRWRRMVPELKPRTDPSTRSAPRTLGNLVRFLRRKPMR